MKTKAQFKKALNLGGYKSMAAFGRDNDLHANTMGRWMSVGKVPKLAQNMLKDRRETERLRKVTVSLEAKVDKLEARYARLTDLIEEMKS